jgi:hypothetical protein
MVLALKCTNQPMNKTKSLDTNPRSQVCMIIIPATQEDEAGGRQVWFSLSKVSNFP